MGFEDWIVHGVAYNPVAFEVKARHNTVVSRHCDCWEDGSDIRNSDASFLQKFQERCVSFSSKIPLESV